MTRRKPKRRARVWTTDLLFGALRSTVVGAGLAIAVGAVIVLASYIPFIEVPFRAIERAGMDVGMRVAAEALRDRRSDTGDAESVAEPPYVFLDIGENACDAWLRDNPPTGEEAAFATYEDECLHPAAPRLVAQLAMHVVEWSGTLPPPRLLVFDASMPESVLARAAAPIPNVPIVAIANMRPKAAGDRVVLEYRVSPKATFLPTSITLSTDLVLADPESDGDDAVRRYPAARLVYPNQRSDFDTLMPSIGFATAAIAWNRDTADALFRQFSSREARDCSTEAVHSVARRLRVDAAALCTRSHATDTTGARYEVDKKLFYTVRSLSPPTTASSDAPARSQLRYSGTSLFASVYRRVPVVYDGRFARIAPQVTSNAVVIIGSSALSARDWHATPLGYMTGPEVIINAARSFRMFDTPAEESFWARLGHKVVLGILSALLFLPCWLLVGILSARPAALLRNASKTSWLLGHLCGWAVAIVFLLGMAWTVVGVSYWVIAESRAPFVGAAVPADVLTPVLAVSLEGFAEATYVLKHSLERLVHRMKLPWLGQ
jgi:hypothetical protein